MSITQPLRWPMIFGALAVLPLLTLTSLPVAAAGPADSSVAPPPSAVAHSPVAAPPHAAFELAATTATAAATTPQHRRTPSTGTKQGALAVAVSTVGLLALVIGTILVVSRSRRPVDGRPRGIFGARRGSGPPGEGDAP